MATTGQSGEKSSMVARIYRPSKTAMQSGRARTKDWVLEFEQSKPRRIDPLMGWTSSADTATQVRLRFESLDQAKEYAAKAGLAFQVVQARERTPKSKSYSDNFRTDRRVPWSH